MDELQKLMELLQHSSRVIATYIDTHELEDKKFRQAESVRYNIIRARENVMKLSNYTIKP